MKKSIEDENNLRSEIAIAEKLLESTKNKTTKIDWLISTAAVSAVALLGIYVFYRFIKK